MTGRVLCNTQNRSIWAIGYDTTNARSVKVSHDLEHFNEFFIVSGSILVMVRSHLCVELQGFLRRGPIEFMLTAKPRW